MNSRSGMSTPVESMSTVTTMRGCGRLRNSRMRCSGRSTSGPVIFWTNASPRPKTSRAECHKLVRVGRVGQVVGGEDQRFRESAVSRLVFVGVFLDFLETLAVRVGSRDLPLDFGRVEGSLVFELVELFLAGLGVDELDLFALS